MVVKELFPLSKITFTIHDQAWCSTLRGNYDLLSRIMVKGEEPKELPRESIDYVKRRGQMDIELYKTVDAVICLSETTCKVLTEIYGIDTQKIQFIPNGYKKSGESLVDKYAVRRELGLYEEDEILLFVGRPSDNKVIVPLLLSLDKLTEKHPRIKCIFTGSPSALSKYWKIAGKLAPHIICIGQVPHEELRSWYIAADLGVIASYSEQCSYAALEMMGNGLTIVSSDGNGLRDVFSDGHNAFVACIEDVFDPKPYSENLAKAINCALEASPETKISMAEKNRRLLEDKYSVDVMIEKYHEVLTSI